MNFKKIKLGVVLLGVVLLGLSMTTSAKASEDLIVNGGFENGSNDWILAGSLGPYIYNGSYPRSGSYYAVMGDRNNQNDILSQFVSIPFSALNPELKFFYNISSVEPMSSGAVDLLAFGIMDENGVFQDIKAIGSNMDKDVLPGGSNYHLYTYDMSNFKGKTVEIRFVAITSPSYPTTFRLDDVSLMYEEQVGLPKKPYQMKLRYQYAESILMWIDNSLNKNDRFRIKRSVGGGEYSFLTELDSGITNYFDSENILPGYDYCYRVTAFNSVGESPYIQECINGLTHPSNLTVEYNSTANNMMLNWQDNSNDENGFYVHRNINNSGYSRIATVSENQNFYTNTSITNGNTYCYKVQWHRYPYTSFYSNIECATVDASVPKCGNGVIETGEECDDGSDGSESCSLECILRKGSISGCKYEDSNADGIINEFENSLSNWEIKLIGCPFPALDENTLQFLPNSSINENPQPGDVGHCLVLQTTYTGGDGCYSFNDLDEGNYGISEAIKTNWTQTYPENDTFYYFDLKPGETEIDKNFLNKLDIYQCSDGIDNDGDGLVDMDDLGCENAEDDDETDATHDLPGDFELTEVSSYCDTQEPVGPAVRLEWESSAGAQSYEIYRNDVKYITLLSSETTFENNTGLVAGETYTYFIRAINDNGFTDSNEVTVGVLEGICGVPENRPPNPPINLLQKYNNISIEAGGIINPNSIESVVKFLGDISDPDGDKVELQVEKQYILGMNPLWDILPNEDLMHKSEFVESGMQAYANANVLIGNYRWRARAVDEYGSKSEWVDFGSNNALGTDFEISQKYLEVEAGIGIRNKYIEINGYSYSESGLNRSRIIEIWNKLAIKAESIYHKGWLESGGWTIAFVDMGEDRVDSPTKSFLGGHVIFDADYEQLPDDQIAFILAREVSAIASDQVRFRVDRITDGSIEFAFLSSAGATAAGCLVASYLATPMACTNGAIIGGMIEETVSLLYDACFAIWVDETYNPRLLLEEEKRMDEFAVDLMFKIGFDVREGLVFLENKRNEEALVYYISNKNWYERFKNILTHINDIPGNYKPDPHGYSFSNGSYCKIIVNDKGERECEDYSFYDLSIDSKKIIINEVFDLSNVSDQKQHKYIDKLVFGADGNCFGMSATALLEYEGYSNFLDSQLQAKYIHQLNQSKFTGSDGSWSGSWDGSGNINTKPVLKNIVKYQVAQYASMDTESGTHDVINTLLNNFLPGYLLSITNNSGDEKYINDSHTLVPYEVKFVTDSDYEVRVYDSNYPGNNEKFVKISKKNLVDWIWEYQFTDDSLWAGGLLGERLVDSSLKLTSVKELYNNNQKFKLPNLLLVSLGIVDLNSIYIEDSEGRITGYNNGSVVDEIPGVEIFNLSNGIYDTDNSSPIFLIAEDKKDYKYHIESKEDNSFVSITKFGEDYYLQMDGVLNNNDVWSAISFYGDKVETSGFGNLYDLEVNKDIDGEATTFTAANIPTTSGEVHQFSINWQALSQGEAGVTMQIDEEGDGVFEQTIISDATLEPPTADAGGPYENTEGTEIIFDASLSMDADGSIVLYEWDFDGDGNYDESSISPTIIYTYGDNYNGEVILRVTDDEGLIDVTTAGVQIDNVDPEIETFGDQTIEIFDELLFENSFTDAGWLDTHNALIKWGDGTEDNISLTEENEAPKALGKVIGSHVYNMPGVYTTVLIIEDDDGGVGDSEFEITVEKRKTELVYTGDLNGQYSDEITFQAVLTDKIGGVAGKTINFNLGDQFVSAVTNSEGVAETEITLNEIPGNYEIETSFQEDEFYLSSSNPTDFEIMKDDTILSIPNGEIVYSDDTTIQVTLYDNENEFLLKQADSQKTVYLEYFNESEWKFIAKDALYSTDDMDDTLDLYFQIPDNLDKIAGNYDLRARFLGDDCYNETISEIGNLEVLKEDTILSDPSATVTYSDSSTLEIIFQDDDGETLFHQSDEPKTVYLEVLDGTEWKILSEDSLNSADNSDNTLTFTFEIQEGNIVDLLAGNYDLRARFDGDSRYNSTATDGTLTIVKKSVVITVKDQEGFFDDTVILEATILDDDGEVLYHNPNKVNFAVGGNVIGEATIDENSKSEISWVIDYIPTNSNETYPIVVSFTGNEYYLSGEGQGEFIVKSAKQLKQDTLAKLKTITTNNKQAQKEIDKAIEDIENSLNLELWADSSKLDKQQGHKVFDREKQAVKSLLKIIEEKGKHDNPEIMTELQTVIDDLVKVDILLAKTAIYDAENIEADDTDLQKKIDDEINKANEELKKAFQELADNNSDKAIFHLKKSWKSAQLAIDFLLDKTNRWRNWIKNGT